VATGKKKKKKGGGRKVEIAFIGKGGTPSFSGDCKFHLQTDAPREALLLSTQGLSSWRRKIFFEGAPTQGGGVALIFHIGRIGSYGLTARTSFKYSPRRSPRRGDPKKDTTSNYRSRSSMRATSIQALLGGIERIFKKKAGAKKCSYCSEGFVGTGGGELASARVSPKNCRYRTSTEKLPVYASIFRAVYPRRVQLSHKKHRRKQEHHPGSLTLAGR